MEPKTVCVRVCQGGHRFEIRDVSEKEGSLISVSCYKGPLLLEGPDEALIGELLEEEQEKSRYIRFQRTVLADGSFCISGCVQVREASVFFRARIIRALMTACLSCLQKAAARTA
ncbi:MAG: hypothetical protein IJ106_11095 [Parasporobacterium sp.]|nr:hypothetical protein [Parasporobacterium sp.]